MNLVIFTARDAEMTRAFPNPEKAARFAELFVEIVRTDIIIRWESGRESVWSPRKKQELIALSEGVLTPVSDSPRWVRAVYEVNGRRYEIIDGFGGNGEENHLYYIKGETKTVKASSIEGLVKNLRYSLERGVEI